jgi:hypothetical protein
MGEEIKNDILIYCLEKNKDIIKEIKLEKYSSSLIKSGYNKTINKIYLIQTNEPKRYFKTSNNSKKYQILSNNIYTNSSFSYLSFIFSKKTKFRIKVIQKNKGYFFFGFLDYKNRFEEGIYYYPKEHEIYINNKRREKIGMNYLKEFTFELNKKIGIKYSKIDKCIYFYKDGKEYLFFDNYVMPKSYRASVTCSAFNDSFKVYNFKK